MALFGEKYGNVVRVVDVNGYSIELCGGTHVDNTAKIGLFKIISENSVASGIRRIEAVTGGGVLELVNDINGLLNKVAAVFKVSNPAELVAKGEAIHNELKAKRRRIGAECEIADMKMDILQDSTVDINGVRVVSASFNTVKPDALRIMGDKIKEKRLKW